MVLRLKSRCICLHIHTFLQESPDSWSYSSPLVRLARAEKAPPLLMVLGSPHPDPGESVNGTGPRSSFREARLTHPRAHPTPFRSAGCTPGISPLHLAHSSDPCYLTTPHWADKARGLRKLTSLAQDRSAKNQEHLDTKRNKAKRSKTR